MPTMRFIVTADDGTTPLPGVEVKVDMPNQAIVTATGALLSGSVWQTSGDDGSVEYNLVPSSALNPAGTHYVLSLPFVDDDVSLPFVVPDLTGTYSITDYLVEQLPAPGPIEVGVSSAELQAALAALGAGVVGANGQPRFAGVGPPPLTIIGAEPGDIYLNASNGDLYQLT